MLGVCQSVDDGAEAALDGGGGNEIFEKYLTLQNVSYVYY